MEEQIELRYENLMKKVGPLLHTRLKGGRRHADDLLRSIGGSIWRLLRQGRLKPKTNESGFIWKLVCDKVANHFRKLGRQPKAVASVEDTDPVDHWEVDPAREAKLQERRAMARSL